MNGQVNKVIHTYNVIFPGGSAGGGSAGKESTCNAGDPFDSWVRKIPWRRDGYPLWYFGASLVAQMVKNPPALQASWVRSLGWEDSLEVGMATHSSTLAWRIPMERGAWWATVHRVAKSWTRLSTKHNIIQP